MGKKKEGKKKSKKSKSSLHASSTAVPVISLYSGNGKFDMENGDSYNGEYCAHRIGIVWREGNGIYRTHDGQTYEGLWKDDVLVNNSEAVIKFPNKQKYRGRVIKNKANGPGTFTLENSMEICCEFQDNKPVGHIVLIDIFGHVWEGEAEHNNALLFPENIFYKVLTPDCGKGELKLPKVPRIKTRPPLKSCKSGENILLMPEVGGYLYTKADAAKFSKEDAEYFNAVDSETQVPKPPKQLESEFIPYERVFGIRRRFIPEKVPVSPKNTLSDIAIAAEESTATPIDTSSAIEDTSVSAIDEDPQVDIEEKLTRQIFECELDVNELEKIVFAKSGKISFEGVFSYEAKYIQDYLKFKKRKVEILEKADEYGYKSLTVEEKHWLTKYHSFVRHMKSMVHRKKHHHVKDESVDTDILDQFYSKEWREKYPAVVTYYPTIEEKTVKEIDVHTSHEM